MKRDWSDGYVADITYSSGYFHELAPSYLRYHLLVNGFGCPSEGGEFAYCELGYGQGVSANVHAAANPRGQFWGTDFNSDHALNARDLASRAGLGANWLDISFEAFLDTPTPQFDFIVIHGVWSWVSPSAQHALVEFMRRKLKPGGAVFLSYNVLPGWNSEKPLRDLLWMHTEHASAPGASTPTRIANALQFARNLRRQGCSYFVTDTRASTVLDEMLGREPGSLAHEYFNRSWSLSYFFDVERALQAAHLDFACSVHMSDISGEVRERLAGANFIDASMGVPLRETTADFMLNRRFRRDVFTRGRLRLTEAERWDRLDEVRFTLLRPADQVSMFLSTPYGRIPLEEARIKPLVELLAAAQSPVKLSQLRAAPELAGWAPEDLLLNLSRLVARRDVCPIFSDDAARARDSRCAALNAAIARKAIHDMDLRYFASPVSGAGVEAPWLDRLFWLAWQEGARSAASLSDRLRSSNLIEEGEAARAQTEVAAETFLATTVPIWRRLGLLETRPAKAHK